jgi:hypothetical protein
MHDTELRSIAALREAQGLLIDEVAGPGPVRVLVHAPTGSGKTTAAIAAANKLIGLNPLSRIAFLVSHSVMGQSIRERLEGPSFELSTKVSVLSAESGLPRGTALIAQRALGSLDLQALLFSNEWDLVVVDDADSLNSTGLATLRRLAESTEVQRLLVFSRGLLDLPDPRLTEIPLTHLVLWHVALEDLSRLGERTLQVRYARSPTELQLVDRATALVVTLAPWLEAETIERLRVAQNSTLFAFQAELLGLADFVRKRRNALAHLTTDEAASSAASREFDVLSRATRELESVADELDVVEVDTKVEALKHVVSDLSKRKIGPIVVFVRSEASANYLGSALSDAATVTRALAAEPLTRPDLVQEVVDRKGVVVLSDDALPGYDLRRFNVGVHFDSDIPEDLLNEREARVGAIDQRTRLLFVALVAARSTP